MRFVIITAPRTGSNHLVTQLGREEQIWCHSEAFHPHNVALRWPGWPTNKPPGGLLAELRALRRADPDEFLSRVYALNFGRPHVGFKMFESHNRSVLAKLLVDPEIAKIVHIRSNVLANYASKLLAKRTGRWAALGEDERAAVPTVRFDECKFLAHHNQYMNFFSSTLENLNASGQPYHLVRYDELNNPILLARLAQFIAGTSAPGPSPAREHTPGSSNILSRFSNPDDVERFLQRHGRLEWIKEGQLDFAALSEERSDLLDTERKTA